MRDNTEIRRGVSWWKYGKAYDLLCSINPYYEENLAHFGSWFRSIPLPSGSLVCEIGAGTGNVMMRAAEMRPEVSYVHWDWNSVMNELARTKYGVAGFTNVEIVSKDLALFPAGRGPFDLIIAVNCLYTLGEVGPTLDSIRNSLKPDGMFYCIDIGRPLDTYSWARELFLRSLKQRGFFKTIGLLFRLRQAVIQNKAIDKSQSSGAFWEHSPDSFKRAMEIAGFAILEQGICYRDICDWAICTPAIGKASSTQQFKG